VTAALDAVMAALVERGCDPRKTGANITARCPAHDDRNPSLSIGEGKTQPVVVHCHAGCEPRHILETLGLTWGDLCNDRPNTDPVMDVYDYRDADNNLRYQVLRYSSKRFAQRHPGPTGEWVWNIRGIEPLPYRLPQVIDAIAAGHPIWVVEGEKDVETLRRLGHTATCNSGGAGRWTGQHSQWLEGAEIHIVADNDEPGIKHALHIQQTLQDIDTESTIWLARHGKDLTDHIQHGYSTDQLVPYLNQTPHPLTPWLIDWDELWHTEYRAEWLLEPLFAQGRSHALYAGAKSGKSYLILAACAALATGRPFLDHPGGEPVHVLYVDFEMTAEDVRDRLEEYGYGPDDDLSHLHYALLPTLPPLDTEPGGQALLESAQAVEAQFVIIDTTSRSISGEENSADTMRAFYRCTGMLLKQALIGWMRLDHAGKAADRGQRGSSAKNDDVDVVIRLERTDQGQQLVATHRRMSWYPEKTPVLTEPQGDGTYRFKKTKAGGWPAGTADLANTLDTIGVPVEASRREARKIMQEHDVKGDNAVLSAALKYRRSDLRRDHEKHDLEVLAGLQNGPDHFQTVNNVDI